MKDGEPHDSPFLYTFTQLVVPIAVRIAVMTDARICSVHLMVSFLVISLN